MHAIKGEKDKVEKVVELPITKDMGGEVEEFIKKVSGYSFLCTCGNAVMVDEFLGYKCKSGLRDKEGKDYWVYIKCGTCKFEWSFSIVEHRILMQRQKSLEEYWNGNIK